MSFIRGPEAINIESLTLEEFKTHIEFFENYLKCAELEKKDENFITSHFINTAGKPFFNLLKELKVHKEGYTNIKKAVEKFLKPKENRTIERNRFFNTIKDPEESIKSWASRLLKLAEKCNFEDHELDSVTNLIIKDQFLRGLNDPKLLEIIFTEADLDLQGTINRAESIVQASKDSASITAFTRPAMALSGYPQKKYEQPKHNRFFDRQNSRTIRPNTPNNSFKFCNTCQKKDT